MVVIQVSTSHLVNISIGWWYIAQYRTINVINYNGALIRRWYQLYNQGSMHTSNMRHSCKFLTIDHLYISYSTTIGCRFPGVGQVKLFPAHVKTMSYLYQCIHCHSHLRVLADNTKKKSITKIQRSQFFKDNYSGCD